MILELIIMKLTLDAIMQHCNNIAMEADMREQVAQLKARLLKLMADYESGSIDQKSYIEQEAEIMSSLSNLTRQANNQAGSQPFNSGLGL
ncbi:MAG: hypothetical protein AB1351_06130 [Thermoproteota archaeon]